MKLVKHENVSVTEVGAIAQTEEGLNEPDPVEKDTVPVAMAEEPVIVAVHSADAPPIRLDGTQMRDVVVGVVAEA